MSQDTAKQSRGLVPFEKWARCITGGIFILLGIYYCLTYIFRVFS